jgi:hypothetical protein
MSRRDQRSGLGRFDVKPTPIVRSPARNPDGSVICPECGRDVTDTKGTPRIRAPDLADRELRQEIEELLTFGWICTGHHYDVVIPVECRDRDASNLQNGWIGVRLVFADEITRWVPSFCRELSASRTFWASGTVPVTANGHPERPPPGI